ncbi:hypothetical protein AAY72_10000 [Alishewanella sp. WH16-1]|nr:hypothetical protein AAY72_10000 [Alishewanella sp. WH16-1]
MVLDYLGLKWFYNDLMYSGADITGSITGASLTIQNLIGNAFYLQTIIVPTFGTNGALWSLANEFWYYILFPFLVLALSKKENKRVRLFCLCIFLAIFYLIGYNIVILFPIWLTGLLLVLYLNKTKYLKKSNILVIITGVFFIFCSIAIRIMPEIENGLLSRIYVAIPFLLFCFAIIRSDRELIKPDYYAKQAQTLAGFSYTLYVIHTPLLSFIRGWLIHDSGYWRVTVKNILIFFIIILFITLIAYLLAKISENHTQKIYEKLKI